MKGKKRIAAALCAAMMGASGALGETALISFVGDCSIGDGYNQRNHSGSYHRVIEEKGYDWPFSLVKEYFENDDLTVANLEVNLTTRTSHKDIKFPMQGEPEYTEVLIRGSVEAVNTMNNHALDFKGTGYQDTLDNLDKAGILRFGCNRPDNENGWDDLLVTELNGIRFGFMGFSYPQNNDLPKIEKRVKKLKEEEGCDIVVVSLHWGREGHATPENGAMSYAKKVIDLGADMIYGHHPHILQQMHFYHGKPVLYSTGNFTFGTMSQMDPSTGIFQLTWRKTDGVTELTKLQVIPCETTRSPDFRPFPLTDPEARRECLSQLRFTDKAWDRIVAKKNFSEFVNLPESFLDTGIVYLRNGEVLEAGEESPEEEAEAAGTPEAGEAPETPAEGERAEDAEQGEEAGNED